MKIQKTIIRRRGSILIYALFLMLMMCAIISLAVDYGRMQVIKTEEQRCADAMSRGILSYCLNHYQSTAYASPTAMANGMRDTIAQYIYSKNPVDKGSGITPTYSVTVGSWNVASKKFKADGGAAGPLAIKVIVSRTTANNNSVPLAFPLPSNNSLVTRTVDIWAKSIAMLPDPITLNQTVQGTFDPWLAGMPNDPNNATSYDDYAPANSPVALTVIPGSTLTVNTAVTGSVNFRPNKPLVGPDGDPTRMRWHMQDPPQGAVLIGYGMQNNIGDIQAPIDSLLGVFLDNNPPSAANAPAAGSYRDYSTQAERDNPDFNDLQLQQPFYIGNGINSSGTTASFIVPNGATRFYMGQMDGFEWSNDSGSFSTSFNEQPPIQIVQ